MKNFTNIALATVFTLMLSNCSDKSPAPSSDTGIKQMQAMPKVEMVTTHSVAVNFAVKKIAFAPNSAVPWYGRIILLDDIGKLHSTDIEGRDPKPIKSAIGDIKFTDIFGFARDKAAGVFLAITEQGQIQAFIESDDYGNFSPLIYSGAPIKARYFCQARTLVTDQAIVIDTNGKAIPLTFTLNTGQIEQSAPTNDIDTPSQQIEMIHGQCFYGAPQATQATQATHTFLKHETLPNIIARSNNDATDSKNILIANGLSERGLKGVRAVAYTQANYGGSAYADGVIALADADENRIVFVSLSYAERQLGQANVVTIPTPPKTK